MENKKYLKRKKDLILVNIILWGILCLVSVLLLLELTTLGKNTHLLAVPILIMLGLVYMVFMAAYENNLYLNQSLENQEEIKISLDDLDDQLYNILREK